MSTHIRETPNSFRVITITIPGFAWYLVRDISRRLGGTCGRPGCCLVLGVRNSCVLYSAGIRCGRSTKAARPAVLPGDGARAPSHDPCTAGSAQGRGGMACAFKPRKKTRYVPEGPFVPCAYCAAPSNFGAPVAFLGRFWATVLPVASCNPENASSPAAVGNFCDFWQKMSPISHEAAFGEFRDLPFSSTGGCPRPYLPQAPPTGAREAENVPVRRPLSVFADFSKTRARDLEKCIFARFNAQKLLNWGAKRAKFCCWAPGGPPWTSHGYWEQDLKHFPIWPHLRNPGSYPCHCEISQ